MVKIEPFESVNTSKEEYFHQFLQVFGKPVTHYAHKADVIRMQAIIKYGGIYTDSDFVMLQDIYDPKWNVVNENVAVVLGLQAREVMIYGKM